MRKDKVFDTTKVKWSHPMSIKELSLTFDVHRNTMSKWLKDQVICNRQLSPRRWEVAIYELPNDFEIERNHRNYPIRHFIDD